MRFNPRASSDDSQIDDRGGDGGGFGGGGMQLPIPSGLGTGGRAGIGSVVVLVLFLVLSMCTRGGPFSNNDLQDPSRGSGQPLGQQDQGQPQDQSGTDSQTGGHCTGAQANADPEGDCAIRLVTESVQDFWNREYPKQTGKQYEQIKTVIYSGQTDSGCGQAASSMGPFYCPNDKRVYVDRSFMKQMLEGQLGAKGGSFALGYVVAHEYGHHIEDQLGIFSQVRTQQGENSDSVKLELMADCLGGVWAASAQDTRDAHGNTIIQDLTQDDVARAIDAAQAVGDDRIQKETSGRVDPEQWTHGSAAERTQAFQTGFTKRSIDACNTFQGAGR